MHFRCKTFKNSLLTRMPKRPISMELAEFEGVASSVLYLAEYCVLVAENYIKI